MKPFYFVNKVASSVFRAFVLVAVGMSSASAADTATVKESSGFSLPPLTAVDASKRSESLSLHVLRESLHRQGA